MPKQAYSFSMNFNSNWSRCYFGVEGVPVAGIQIRWKMKNTKQVRTIRYSILKVFWSKEDIQLCQHHTKYIKHGSPVVEVKWFSATFSNQDKFHGWLTGENSFAAEIKMMVECNFWKLVSTEIEYAFLQDRQPLPTLTHPYDHGCMVS